jgi:hypothetical protein
MRKIAPRSGVLAVVRARARSKDAHWRGRRLATGLAEDTMIKRLEKGIDALASTVTGVVKATKGKLAGLTGVFVHLAREHGEVTALLLRVQASSDPELRALLFPQIRAELLSHEKGELAEVYPMFDRFPELERFTGRHNADADKLEAIIAELSAMPYTDAGWPARFRDLVQAVSRHATEEENEMFPVASRVLGRETTAKMLERFEAAKARVKKGLSASAKRTGAPRKPSTLAARTANRTTRKASKKTAAPRARKGAKAPAKKTPAKKGARRSG